MSSYEESDALLTREQYESVRSEWQSEISHQVDVLRISLNDDVVAIFQSRKSVLRAVYEARRDDPTIGDDQMGDLMKVTAVLLPDEDSAVCMLLRSPGADAGTVASPTFQCVIDGVETACEMIPLVEERADHPTPTICRCQITPKQKEAWNDSTIELRIPEMQLAVSLSAAQKQAMYETMSAEMVSEGRM